MMASLESEGVQISAKEPLLVQVSLILLAKKKDD